jgi:hypothetical protein
MGKKPKKLERDLLLANLQSKKYAHDFVKIYKDTKAKQEELGTANRQLKKYAQDLRATISTLEVVNQELQEAYYDTIHRLAMAVEYKDKFISARSSRRRSGFLRTKSSIFSMRRRCMTLVRSAFPTPSFQNRASSRSTNSTS